MRPYGGSNGFRNFAKCAGNADLRRHPSTIVRNGSGREKLRMESWERLACVDTTMLGSSRSVKL